MNDIPDIERNQTILTEESSSRLDNMTTGNGTRVAPQDNSAEKDKSGNNRDAEILDWLQCIVSALVFCVLLFTFAARTVGVIGSSMVPTLEENDRLIVSKLFYEPKYGDIVVVRKESFMTEPIIKRVIATAGQTVDIDFDAGIVYVDGRALNEPYINAPTQDPEDFTDPVTVPDGYVFLMGDNRNRSTDSRCAQVGLIDCRLIIGKAYLRITPIAKFGKIY